MPKYLNISATVTCSRERRVNLSQLILIKCVDAILVPMAVDFKEQRVNL